MAENSILASSMFYFTTTTLCAVDWYENSCMMTWNGFEGKKSWPNCTTILEFASRDWQKM